MNTRGGGGVLLYINTNLDILYYADAPPRRTYDPGPSPSAFNKAY